MTEAATLREIGDQANAGNGTATNGANDDAVDFAATRIGVAPFFSLRQQSGIGQQSGDATFDEISTREQHGRRNGIPNPQRRPMQANRLTARFTTAEMLHLNGRTFLPSSFCC